MVAAASGPPSSLSSSQKSTVCPWGLPSTSSSSVRRRSVRSAWPASPDPSIATTVVLTGLGLPLEGMALLLGIDAIVDMGRTAVNATGTTVSSLLVGVWEGEFDRAAFADEEDDALELDAGRPCRGRSPRPRPLIGAAAQGK